MLDAQLLRFAGRMKWIAEADDAGERLQALSGQMRGNASAHRFAADEQTIGLAPFARRGGRLSKRLLEDRRPVGRALLQPLVREIERHDVDAARRQAARHTGHERMVLPGAGPMGEDEHSERSPLRGYACAPS